MNKYKYMYLLPTSKVPKVGRSLIELRPGQQQLDLPNWGPCGEALIQGFLGRLFECLQHAVAILA